MSTEHLGIKSILLVDDDPRDVELTLTALETHNLANKVAVVHDGAEALDYLFCRGKFAARPPTLPLLILLDNKMPKVSGLEVLRAIRADERLKLVPVVALTSSRETPDLVEFYNQGVNAYVVKPVDFVDFMKAVRQLGVFWVGVNEPPPPVGKDATAPASSINPLPSIVPANESSPAHPASGG